MYCQILVLYFALINVYADFSNDFISNYYDDQKVPNVVGFVCNSHKDNDNVLLIKNLSKLGITAVFIEYDEKMKVSSLIKADYYKLGILIDIRCHDIESIASIFLQAADHRFFDELHHWLILGNDLDSVMRLTNDSAFGLLTNFVIAVSSNSTDHYDLYDTYNISRERGFSLNVTFLGYWDKSNGLNFVLKQSKLTRRANLRRVTLKAVFYKCAYKPDDAMLGEYYEDYTYATRDAQSKFGYHLLSHLADMYNFILEPYETKTWAAGDTMGPISRDLINETADFTGTPISMNIPRTHLMKFVHQDYPFRTCWFFRNPQPTNIKVQEIFRPFDDEVWYFSLSLLIAVMSIFLLVLSYENANSLLERFSNSIIIISAAICLQGTDIKMEKISTRITFLFTLLFSFLMYTYYSSSVISARLDEPIYKINDSLTEFGKLNLKMSSEWMVYLEFFLKRPDWDTENFYKNYWLKLPKSEWFTEPEVGMKLVKQGSYAYHAHPDVGYEYIDKLYDNREICELTEVHVARPIHTAFAVTFNSTFMEISRVGLTKIYEVGLQRRQLKRWTLRKPKCRRDVLSASSINIYEFAPHLILLLIGALMAVLMCVIEIMLSHHATASSSRSFSTIKSI